MAELDGGRVAAVLAADAQLDVRTGLLAQIAGHLDQLAYAVLVEFCEWVELVDLLVVVVVEELCRSSSRLKPKVI